MLFVIEYSSEGLSTAQKSYYYSSFNNSRPVNLHMAQPELMDERQGEYLSYDFRSSTIPDRRRSRSPSPLSDEGSDYCSWPVDTSLMECMRRNSIIRPYIIQRDWHMSLEFKLIKNLVHVLGTPRPEWTPYAERYRYLFDYEWANPSGKGDLIFSDGQNNFLIVEVKTMETDNGASTGPTSRVRRRRKKRHVEEQADKYSRIWHRLNPQVKTTTGVIATENGIRRICELTEQDRS
jgi:hypothetical protein